MQKMIACIQKQWRRPDRDLLIFLVLFLNVKMLVKLVALVWIWFRHPVRSFRFSCRPSGVPWFYPAMIGIAAANLLLYSLYRNADYLPVFFLGIGCWMVCMLVFRQLAATVYSIPAQKIHITLRWFFLLNALVSLADIAFIMLDAGEINPYRYQGNYQEYFIGTGDYIKGLSFDTSTTNAILSGAGVLYFLYRKQKALSLLCMLAVLLTCSNFTNLLLLTCFAWMLMFRSTPEQKSTIVLHVAMMIAFMTNITPQNNQYALHAFEKIIGRVQERPGNPVDVLAMPDSLLTVEERRYKIAKHYVDSLVQSDRQIAREAKQAIIVPKVNIHAPEYQHRPDSSAARKQAISLYTALQPAPKDSVRAGKRYAGKVAAWMQLFGFFRQHPIKMISGNGMGNFSSKLAFRATGLHVAGGYLPGRQYIHPDFRNNHLLVYLDYFVRDTGFHSISNTPNSVYAQLLGEYGLLGLCCFFFFYLGYFLRRKATRGYGMPLLLLLAGAFFSDYWFEQLSVVVFFELLLLLNVKEQEDVCTN